MFACFIFRPGDRLHFYNYYNFCRFGGQPVARPLPKLHLQRCSSCGLDHYYITSGSILQDRSVPGLREPRERQEQWMSRSKAR